MPQEEIIDSYFKELDFYQTLTSGREITSIFFGGGTPSLIKPRNVERLIDYVAKKWPLSAQVEISLEANPNSQYPQMFADLRHAGINRLSLGVQAMNDADLKFLGRTHCLTEAEQAIDSVLKNFDNHSMDLIYARPNQKVDDWLEELKLASGFGFKHLSLYQLTIEEGTVFERKGIEPLDEAAAAEMYLATENSLQKKGYQKYEVSNYTLPGYASRHNLLYWQGGEYIGVGKSAAGRLSVFNGNLKQNSDARNSRTKMYAQVSALRDFTLSSALKTDNESDGNLKQNSDIQKFYATSYCCQLEELTPQERAEELILMGMRLVSGIDKAQFKQACGLELEQCLNLQNVADLQAQGLILYDGYHLRATTDGFLVLNKIIEELVNL